MNGTLEIALKSDLCVASGYSFAGVIDTDVVFDEFGIPYIPARRIKGCLREAAELIGINETDRMFGSSGNSCPGSLYISDAVIEDYEKVRNECQRVISSGKITREEIADAFSYVRGQTKIDEKSGIKANNALRYTRVIKQKSPFGDNDDMVFFSEICFDGSKENLENAAKALRNIGMSRNRGLGSVRCAFSAAGENGKGEPTLNCEIGAEDDTLHYVIMNTDSLMLSGNRNDVSETYISGKAVLGALAAEYLRQSGGKECESFKKLFLNDGIWFSNAYPAESGCTRCYPAPLYIRELKKTKKVVNTLRMNHEGNSSEDDVQYDPRGGNQPKKLKEKYWNFNNNKKLKMRMEVVYHHARPKNVRRTFMVTYVPSTVTYVVYHHARPKNGRSGELYALEVIPRRRYFAGEIHGSSEDIRKISELLKSADLRFGKSRTAQYGSCKLVDLKAAKAEKNIVVKDGKIVVTLLSDAVFCDENGYTTEFNKVSTTIAEALGIGNSKVCKEECIYETSMRTGYNTQWNLSSPLIPAIAAGSAFTFDVGEEKKTISLNKRIGEYTREGCGEYRIDPLVRMNPHPEENTECNEPSEEAACEETENYTYIKSIMNKLSKAKQIECAVKTIGNKSISGEANVGRLTLMLKESMQEHPGEAQKIMEAFKERIGSIKSERAKKDAVSFYNKVVRAAKDENGVVNVDIEPQIAMRLLLNAKYEKKRKSENG